MNERILWYRNCIVRILVFWARVSSQRGEIDTGQIIDGENWRSIAVAFDWQNNHCERWTSQRNPAWSSLDVVAGLMPSDRLSSGFGRKLIGETLKSRSSSRSSVSEKKKQKNEKKGSDHHQRHYRCENPSCPAVKQEATTLITDHTATIAHKLLARQKMGLTSSSESGLPFIFESMLWYLSDGGRINDKHQRTRLEPRKEHRKGVSPWAKCNRTKAMTKDSPVRTRFLANRSTRHSRTLLLTVKPASHKIGRRL